MERLILNQLRAIGLVLTVLLLGLPQDFLVEVMAMQVEVMDILGLVIVLEQGVMDIVMDALTVLAVQDILVQQQLRQRLPEADIMEEVMGPMLMVVRHNMEAMLLDLLIILEDMPVVLVLPIQAILVLEAVLMAEDTMLLEVIRVDNMGHMIPLAGS